MYIYIYVYIYIYICIPTHTIFPNHPKSQKITETPPLHDFEVQKPSVQGRIFECPFQWGRKGNVPSGN